MNNQLRQNGKISTLQRLLMGCKQWAVYGILADRWSVEYLFTPCLHPLEYFVGVTNRAFVGWVWEKI